MPWHLALVPLFLGSMPPGPPAGPGGPAPPETALRPQLMVQLGHSGAVGSIAFSPDGRLVLTGGFDYTARLWDVATGSVLRRFHGAEPTLALVSFVGFVPPDGRKVFTACGRDWRVWETATGRELVRFEGHTEGASSVAFTPDGGAALVGGAGGGRTGDPRLYDLSSGRETGRFPLPFGSWDAVALSPDGRRALTGGEVAGPPLRLWDVATGKEVRRFEGCTSPVNAVAFSPDGLTAVSGAGEAPVNDSPTLQLWDVATGRLLRAFDIRGRVNSVAFLPGSDRILTASGMVAEPDLKGFQGNPTPEQWKQLFRDAEAKTRENSSIDLWDAVTGARLRRFPFEGHGVVHAAVPSPDGRRVLSYPIASQFEPDAAARLTDAATGEVVRRFEGIRSRAVNEVAFSPDGRGLRMRTGPTGREGLGTSSGYRYRSDMIPRNDAAWAWNLADGSVTRHDQGALPYRFGRAFSPDGRLALTFGPGEGSIRLWALVAMAPGGRERPGHLLRDFPGDPKSIESAAISPDNRFVLVGASDKTARLWDVATGIEVRRFDGHPAAIKDIAFSRDGARALTVCAHVIRLWEVATGRLIRLIGGDGSREDPRIVTANFSPGGRWIVSGESTTQREPQGSGPFDPYVSALSLYDAETGREVRPFQYFGPVAFSPDDRRLLTVDLRSDRFRSDQVAVVRDAETGREVTRLKGHANDVSALAFSRDGNFALTGSWDNTARLWDTGTGQELRQFVGHTDYVGAVAISRDGKAVLTGSWDGTVRLWDAESGRYLCSLVGMPDGSWAVVDAANRYDASNGGDISGLQWVVGTEPIELGQLKERYYDPGLLAKHLGLATEPLRTVEGLADVKLFPRVELTGPKVDDPRSTLGIALVDRGGGVGRVVVKVNGKELTADARGPAPAPVPPGGEAHLLVPLAGDPRLVPGRPNRIEVEVYNAEGYLRSRSSSIEIVPEGEPPRAAPELWGVIVGISDYVGDQLDLRFAAKDAEDFATAVRVAAARLFGADKVHLAVLTSARPEPGSRPTRANIARALEAARGAGPGDVVVVYLAGHGVSLGDDYYYLTADARSADLSDPEVRARDALSSFELTEALKVIPAERQVLILDTCAAGRAIERMTDRRDVPGSQARALERVQDRTGMHVLAGAAADAVSFEASRFGQGLLTYSLLLGIRGAALKDGTEVDTLTLFGFAVDAVPGLAQDIGGIQRPLLSSPRGGASFPIGQVLEEDKPRIPLERVRPLVLQSRFFDEKEDFDVLGLERLVDEQLCDQTARGREAPLVFVDARSMPGSYQLTGRYRAEGAQVTVRVGVRKDNQKVGEVVVTGPKDDVPRLARDLVEKVGPLLESAGGG